MAGGLGTLRRRILVPKPDQNRAEVRGFHVKNDASRELLESVSKWFREGFGHALETGDPIETGARLQAIERQYQGFSYEGATMGLALLDVMSLHRHDRVARFLAGPAKNVPHQVHVGLGFALARMPRFRWRVFLPADPMLRWRTLDGYGFHQAFFKTDKYVHAQYQDPGFPWPKEYPNYVNRAIDQGIGRALWFVGGSDVARVATLIEKFDPGRRAELWSGAGLAATYAGGANEPELKQFWELAGSYRPQVAQGGALASTTRARANLVNDNTRTAAAIFCGMSPEDAAAVTDEARKDLPPDGALPAFEVWRQRIQQRFA
ncbi:DUF1702 family protein [Micromonospora sp. SL1-18]|uniref:DUF1702 family protein n=1 Tax=Micromonospora sp. SL1-18 TaxID=3399128 RepID=UPI003A4E5900